MTGNAYAPTGNALKNESVDAAIAAREEERIECGNFIVASTIALIDADYRSPAQTRAHVDADVDVDVGVDVDVDVDVDVGRPGGGIDLPDLRRQRRRLR